MFLGHFRYSIDMLTLTLWYIADIQIPSRPLVGALRPQHGKKQRPLSGPSHLSGGSRIAAMKPRASSAGPIRNTSNRNPLLYKPIPMHDQRNADGDEAIATAEEDGVVYDTNTTFPSIQIEAQKLAHHRRSSIKGVRGGENTSVAADDFHGKSSKSYDALAKNEVCICLFRCMFMSDVVSALVYVV